jgi:RNA polymerase sigma-70 factor, ECF subfamily
MPSAAAPYPGLSEPRFGLRALAALVNEALGPMDTRTALLLSHAMQSPAPRAAQMSIGVTNPARTGRARAPATAGHARGGPPEPPQPDFVDEEHVETWRLVTLAQAGDGDAFGQLYDRYVDIVFRFVYYRVNDRGLAEDFTSETFLRALRRINTISYQGRDIGAWFVTIARNIVLDHVKSARHRLEITTADTIEGRHVAPSPESAVLTALSSEALMTAVNQLGDEQRECVLLRFMQGFSVSETAAVMGKKDGAIKALQHRAVRKLAELVGEDLR